MWLVVSFAVWLVLVYKFVEAGAAVIISLAILIIRGARRLIRWLV